MDGAITKARSRTRFFRRYPNRKLYDTHESRYVNLSHVAKVIRAGADVRVLDSQTLEDLTGTVLARILSFDRTTVSGSCRRKVYDLVRASGRDAADAAGAVPAQCPDEGPNATSASAGVDWPERLVDGLLGRGHRDAWRARQMVEACLAALGRLDDRARRHASAASVVAADIVRLRHELSTFSSKLDALYERLLALEASDEERDAPHDHPCSWNQPARFRTSAE